MSTKTVGAAGAAGTFDYTCDGTNDETEIIAAISAAGSGGTVRLSAGTFVCAADLALSAGRSLLGTAGTIIAFTGAAARRILALGTNTVADIEITGPGRLVVYGSAVAVSSVTCRQAIYGDRAFGIHASSKTITGVSFTDCHALGTSGTGFMITGEGVGALVDGATFAGCTAIDCGKAHDNADATAREWITGFNFAEGSAIAIANVAATDCRAEGCYESGFHCEAAPPIASCSLTRCTSANNGRDKPPPSYGNGFLVPPSWALTDCISAGDYCSFRVANHADNPHTGEPATLVRCRAVSPATHGFKIAAADGLTLDAVTLADCVVDGVAAPSYYLWLYGVTGAQVTDLLATNCTGTFVQGGGSSGNTITYYVAPFGVAPAAPYAGQEVAFADLSENDGLSSWLWTFGDGTTSAAQHPTHAYPTAGVYPVSLTAGGSTFSATVTVRGAIVYGGVELSYPDVAPLDHAPVANATDLQNGRVGLQGSPVSRRTWTINALTDDRAEIEALAALKGQHLTLNINGTEYPGTMIRPPLLETQLTPAAWAYQVGFIQETRR